MNGDLKPALKTLLRAYGVGWSVTTAPALVSVIIKALLDKKNKSSAIQKAIFTIIPQLLRKMRAFDVFAHRIYVSPKVRQKVPEWTLEYGNIAIFMLASTEIIFSWFYEPERLPRSYAGWITNMSGIDDRLLKALRAIRQGDWVYGKDTGLGHLLGDYCVKLGLPRSYGDPLSGRIDCSVIHEGNSYGCEVNALNRFYKGFIKIFPVYLSVHLAPPLFFRTSRLLQNPASSILHILLASVRSSTFLGTYIAIIWYSICLVRTRIGHQVLGVNQTRLDDSLGPLLGAMLCGLSLLVESKHRRGEMTLYVVPRALFSFTERILSPHQKGRWWEHKAAEVAENLAFAASVMVVIDAVYKDKYMVRPSIRGLMSWILKDEIKSSNQNDQLEFSGDSTPVEEEDESDEKALEITKK
ncbi:hypothetical protein INT46_002492 [Mucor plumbeus]|uniref:Transmembrane protein 135 N-terminal domain-containing protein n=1 Tax=Mucor plumbeus TaxID=97098 RepID=A0A8H7RP35_9FUNG|nr:hypothetical protein INT46_002492 [Mucor plumbeus]